MFSCKLLCILLLSVTSVLGARQCYTCDADDCDTAKLENCDDETDTCTTIFKDSGVFKKGCSTELKADCEKDKENCFLCKSNKCNNAKKLTDFIECIDCSSKNNKKCAQGDVTDTKKCYKSCVEYVNPDGDDTDIYTRTCLDDLDEKEQNECNDGKTKMKSCKSCSDPKCNNKLKLVPKEKLSCQVCADIKDCASPSLTECDASIETEQCYAIFETNMVAQMGCLSANKTLTPEQIQKLQDNNQIFLCKENNCNDLKNIQKECSLCSSNSDLQCAQSPDKMRESSKTFCNVVGPNVCYMRVTVSDKSTERGCWTSLLKEEQQNCTKDNNNKYCTACSDSNCNNKIFPENRHRCHICTSEDDKNCATVKPDNLGVCKNYDEDDSCISKIVDGFTSRDCVSSANIVCDGTSRLCRKCKYNGCNVIDFKNVHNDIFNLDLWQEHDLPLTCLQCTTECKNNKTKNEKCTENLEDCMTVFNNEGEIIARGCQNTISNTPYEQYCAENPNLCTNCKSDNCNNATQLNEYVNCTYCGWPNSRNCMEIDANKTYPMRQCHKSCMSALYLHSLDDKIPTFNLIRTCIDDKKLDSQEKCTTNSTDSALCFKCNDENCNNKNNFPNYILSCYSCTTPEQCKNPNLIKCPLRQANDKCYNMYNDQQIIHQKGCQSSLKGTIIYDLLIQNKIGFCSKKECNSVENEPKNGICVLCNSSEDENCAIDPSTVNKTVECVAPISSCYTRVNPDGQTERGCLQTLKEDMLNCDDTAGTNTTCIYCPEGKCNKNIFPENRRKCQVCSSKDDKKCHNKQDFLQVCPLYKNDEKCISKYNIKNKITERGCSQKLKCDDEKDVKTCEICDTSNCNSKDLKKLNGSGTIIGNFMIVSLLSFGLIILSNKN